MEPRIKDLEGKIGAPSTEEGKATLAAMTIFLAGGVAAGLICRYVDENAGTTEALKDTTLALGGGFGAGAAYLGLIKKDVSIKVEVLKNHAINYTFLMSGMVGSYFIM